MNKVTKISAVIVLVAILAFASRPGAYAGEETCWECLTRATEWRAGKAAGDIIVCQPAGSAWGAADKDASRYAIVTICGATEAEAMVLSAPITDATGAPTNECRFTAIVVGENPVITDKTTSLAVTPSDAKAAVEAEKFDLFAIPAEVE